MWPGARTPPTEPLNSVSPVKTSVPSTSSESIPRGVAGRVQRLDRQAADLELLLGLEVAGGAGTSVALAGWISTSASG